MVTVLNAVTLATWPDDLHKGNGDDDGCSRSDRSAVQKLAKSSLIASLIRKYQNQCSLAASVRHFYASSPLSSSFNSMFS